MSLALLHLCCCFPHQRIYLLMFKSYGFRPLVFGPRSACPVWANLAYPVPAAAAAAEGPVQGWDGSCRGSLFR